MLLHNLQHSDDERTAKQVINEQKNNNEKECWYSEVKELMCCLEIEKDPVGVMKPEWKRIVKEAIKKKVYEEAEEKKKSMKKLRFVGEHGRKSYLDEMDGDEIREVMKIKLNMIMTIGGNIGREQKCMICQTINETTEHVLQCTDTSNEDKMTTDCLLSTDKQILRKVLKLFKSYEERREKIANNASRDDGQQEDATSGPDKGAKETLSTGTHANAKRI